MSWHTLVQAEDLARRLDERRLRVFDCRCDLMQPQLGVERYRASHLPGAVFADLNRDLSMPSTPTSGRHPLPDPQVFAAWLRATGVDDDSQVVAYDDATGMFAARLWWMLRWLGHDDVAVLDGGFKRWQDLGLPLTNEIRAPLAGAFTGRVHPEFTVDGDTVQASARDPGQRVIDARAAERYRGEVEPIDRVAGHVPGARNHPTSSLLGADGLFRPPAELRQSLLRSLDGVAPASTITYCGSGVTACHLLLGLEHAGLPGGRLYPGSWSEWSRDPRRPVATGAAP
ncbi:MAG TPA: sulfurtransferase [Steroidobacteraceae bacterium]